MAIPFPSFCYLMYTSHQDNPKPRSYWRVLIGHPQEPMASSDLETRTHTLTEYPKFTENRVTLPSPCLADLIKFLTSNLTAFAFTQPREPPITLQTSQRYRERIPHSVSPRRRQTLTHGAPSMLTWPCLLPTSSSALCCLISLCLSYALFSFHLTCIYQGH